MICQVVLVFPHPQNGGDSWWSPPARIIPELKLGVVVFANTGTAGLALTKLEKAIFSLMIPALASVDATAAEKKKK